MTRLRLHLRSFAWVAFVAMAALAFGPSVSRALGADAMAAGTVHAHCTSDGTPMTMPMPMAAPVPDRGGPADEKAPHRSSGLLDCCALCAVAATPMAAATFALPPWQPAVAVVRAPGRIVAAAPRLRLQWPSAAPRGPPPLS